MAVEPPVMLMDEPFGAVDPIVRERLQNEFIRLHRALGTTVLFVTHDIDEAIYLADRIIVMSASPGRVIEDIPVTLARPRPLEIRNSPEFSVYRQRIWDLLEEQVRASGSWEQEGSARH
jgi:NitT/TauT family transport system ATP-binding protein